MTDARSFSYIFGQGPWALLYEMSLDPIYHPPKTPEDWEHAKLWEIRRRELYMVVQQACRN